MAITLAPYRIAYQPLPKAGCTTVKAALARLDSRVGPHDEPDGDIHLWHAIFPTTRFRPHAWRKLRGWWRFAVVRDPVRRLMSAYTNRVVEMGDLRDCHRIRSGKVDLPIDPDPDFFFANLTAYRRASSAIKHHTLGAELFVGPAPLDYDRVFRTEQMDELALELSRRTGARVSMPRQNPSRRSLGLADLRPETIDALRPFLEQEYALLSGYYRNPL